MIEQIKKLFKVKSLITLSLTAAFIVMLLTPVEVSSEMLALFSTIYGATITYFFTRKDNDNENNTAG